MQEFIKGLVTKGEDVTELKGKVEEKDKEIKRLKDGIDGERNRMYDMVRSRKMDRLVYERTIEDVKDETAREIDNVRNEVEGKVEEAEEKAKKEIEKVKFEAGRNLSRAEDKADNSVRRIKEETAHRIFVLKSENDSAIAIIKMETAAEIESVRENSQTVSDNEYCNDIENLKDRLAQSERRESGAEARASEKDTTIQALKTDLKTHDELIRFVMTKLPSVDLSKFNINIDVPTPEVVVVGRKGGNQSKKDR